MIDINFIGRNQLDVIFSCKDYYKVWNWSLRVCLLNKKNLC